MSSIIKIENLSKKYIINHQAKHLSIRDKFSDGFKNIFNKKSYSSEEFYALKDISFQVEKGDRVGVIGRNGAGKSTLLKILSRIVEPSKGKISLNGKVASLLEVGTGFHPELTGRENIFLNGAILGMSRAEIRSKFDEIVSFAEVEQFLDTPVKKYSSGMYVRLAFSVSAHLEPDILIVDEVLAVGDAQFQKKCLGKMDDVSKSDGRTVLFVSHNLGAVSSLCNKGIYLNAGKLEFEGSITDTIKKYTESDTYINSYKIFNNIKSENSEVLLKEVKIIDRNYQNKNDFNINEKIGLLMEYEVLKEGRIFWLGYNVYNSEGINIFDTHSVDLKSYTLPQHIGKHKAIAWIPENYLSDGYHTINCAIFNHNHNKIYIHEKNVASFNVVDVYDSNTSRGESRGDFPGVVRPYLKWEEFNE